MAAASRRRFVAPVALQVYFWDLAPSLVHSRAGTHVTESRAWLEVTGQVPGAENEVTTTPPNRGAGSRNAPDTQVWKVEPPPDIGVHTPTLGMGVDAIGVSQ